MSPMRPTHAIVRRPSPRVAEGEVTHIDRTPLDVELAFRQHDGYVELLRELGLVIVEAPPADEHPDGLFVEDALVVIEGHAIVTRPGADSRRAETETIAPLVADLGLTVSRITDPATVDGGDVLVTDQHVFVGLSSRSNAAAVEQFDTVVRPLGRTAHAAKVDGCLHLKSAVTSLPDGSLIAVDDWIDRAFFEALGYVVHSAPDLAGGDVLCIGGTVVLPASAAATAAAVRSWGFDAVTIDVGELQKIEAGVTCMSVLF